MDNTLCASAFFCVSVIRAFTRYNVREEGSRHPIMASQNGHWRSVLTHERVVSAANFETPPGLASWCGLSLPLARTQCLHQFRNGKCVVNSCCSTSASLGNTDTFPDFASCASAVSVPSCSNPISILMQFFPAYILADASAFNRYTPPTRSNSIRLPVNSLSIVPTVLRKREDVASVAHLSH